MNWTDLIVFAIIVLFAIIGLKRGFFITIIKIASFFVSVLIAIKLYPVLSKVFQKTAVYLKIKASILNTLLMKKQELTAGGGTEQASESLIDSLPLPEFLKSIIDKGAASAAQGYAELADNVSSQLANLVCDIVSVIVLFAAAMIAFVILKFIFKGIAKLPVFKQLDKIGGLALGAVEGLLYVYILLAVLMLFHSNPKFEKVFNSVENSLVAGSLYENNFIVSGMFPDKGE